MKKLLALLFVLFPLVSFAETAIIHCDATEESLRLAIKNSRSSPGHKTIVIADGTINLQSAIVLDKLDSNLALCGSGHTIISGGLPLQFTPIPGKSYWSAKVPADCAAPALLEINGKNAPIARYPHQNMLEYTDKNDLIWLGSQYGGWTRPPRDYELNQMTVNPSDLPDFDPADAEVLVPHSWNSSLVRVKSVDRVTGIITFANLLRYPVGGFGTKRFLLRNIEAGLAPGHWMFHRATRELFYWPQKGETIDNTKGTAAIAENLLTIRNAENVTLEKLEFAHCNCSAKTDTALALNDLSMISSGLSISGCSNLTLSQITVRNCYGNGIRISGEPASTSIRLLNSTISAAGMNGVTFSVGGDSCITGCTISDIDTTGISAAAHRGSALRIAENRVCGTGYCGISCSTKAGTSRPPANVVIEKNNITRIMMNESINDGGGIYLFGAEGWRVDNNIISETPAFGMRHAIYFDECSHNCTATGNKCSTYFPILCHKARNIIFRDSEFSYPTQMKVVLVDSDNVKLERCNFKAPEILFNIPRDSLERIDCTITGKSTDVLKEHSFTFDFDKQGVLRCTKLPATKQARKLPHRIVCFGDSITATGTFVGELQLYLACRYPKEHIRVFNAGVSGDSAIGGFRRLQKDVLSLAPDMVIVCYGINDVGLKLYSTRHPANDEEAKEREAGYQSYCDNMKKIIDVLVAQGIEVVVMAPFPSDEYGTRPAPDSLNAYSNSVGLEHLAAHCYGTYAKRFLFPMSRTMLCRLYAWFPELQVAPDRVHPNRFGHWVIANEIAKTVFKELPAINPIPFPMTQEMADFANIGKGKKYPGDVFFTPMDCLSQNSRVNGPEMELRKKMDIWLAANGRLKQLAYYDGILRQKGIDPADTAKADPVLLDFAQRWHLTKDVQLYLQGRTERSKRVEANKQAEAEFFKALDALVDHK